MIFGVDLGENITFVKYMGHDHPSIVFQPIKDHEKQSMENNNNNNNNTLSLAWIHNKLFQAKSHSTTIASTNANGVGYDEKYGEMIPLVKFFPHDLTNPNVYTFTFFPFQITKLEAKYFQQKDHDRPIYQIRRYGLTQHWYIIAFVALVVDGTQFTSRHCDMFSDKCDVLRENLLHVGKNDLLVLQHFLLPSPDESHKIKPLTQSYIPTVRDDYYYDHSISKTQFTTSAASSTSSSTQCEQVYEMQSLQTNNIRSRMVYQSSLPSRIDLPQLQTNDDVEVSPPSPSSVV